MTDPRKAREMTTISTLHDVVSIPQDTVTDIALPGVRILGGDDELHATAGSVVCDGVCLTRALVAGGT